MQCGLSSVMTDCKTVVIACYKEDIEWVKQLKDANTIIVQKGVDLPNVGRESLSYLHYIIKEYDNLEGIYYFIQGNPFDHWSTIIDDIKNDTETDIEFFGESNHVCDLKGRPQHSWDLQIAEFANEIELELPEKIFFTRSGQFRVSADILKKYSKDFYQKLYDLHNVYVDAPYIIERIWVYIFLKVDTW